MATPTKPTIYFCFAFALLQNLSSLLDSPHILANDPEAERFSSVVGGFEGSVLARRHSWISPRFNTEIPLLPLCPGTVATGAPVRSARSVFGGRAPAHTKVWGRPKYPVLGTDPFFPHWSHVLINTVTMITRTLTLNNLRRAAQKMQPTAERGKLGNWICGIQPCSRVPPVVPGPEGKARGRDSGRGVCL